MCIEHLPIFKCLFTQICTLHTMLDYIYFYMHNILSNDVPVMSIVVFMLLYYSFLSLILSKFLVVFFLYLLSWCSGSPALEIVLCIECTQNTDIQTFNRSREPYLHVCYVSHMKLISIFLLWNTFSSYIRVAFIPMIDNVPHINIGDISVTIYDNSLIFIRYIDLYIYITVLFYCNYRMSTFEMGANFIFHEILAVCP